MRIKTVLQFGLLVYVIATGLGCTGADPITVGPYSPGVSQLRFVSDLVARFSPDTGQVWIAAPPGWAAKETEVRVSVPGDLPRRILSLTDGSFLYRFAGTIETTATVTWIDPGSAKHEETLAVTAPEDTIDRDIASAGLYANRMTANEDVVWVVNSGDDELASYDIETLQPGGTAVSAPQYSNPWEAAFGEGSTGLLTTLFGGVFKFDTVTGNTTDVGAGGFRPFASPNGAIIVGDAGWVTNPNPVSYFPTEFGQGWVSRIDLSGDPHVEGENHTPWLNPQHVISDGTNIYVSCSGTIDFAPPDYLATALDAGGVLAINQDGGMLNSYELGMCGPGPMALSPNGAFLYVGSGVSGSLFRIDLLAEEVLNDAANPIVLDNFPGTFISFIEVSPTGLMACGSFNTDTIHFVDSLTGEVDPFPFFEPVSIDGGNPDTYYGPQDAVFISRGGEKGLLILTTVISGFHWLPM